VKRRFLLLWTAAVLAAAMAFIVHLSMRFETVRLGYEVGRERRAQRELVESRRNLAIEAATLRQAARVEAVARQVLDMDVPEPERVVPAGRFAKRSSTRTAGRVR
jgi:cell division protein FtsL